MSTEIRLPQNVSVAWCCVPIAQPDPALSGERRVEAKRLCAMMSRLRTYKKTATAEEYRERMRRDVDVYNAQMRLLNQEEWEYQQANPVSDTE